MDTDTVAKNRGILTAGGLIGALLASACCIAPLVFVILGISGAWIGNLTALAPYQWIFVLMAVAFLAAGFWSVYSKPQAACSDESYCARSSSGCLVKAVLWVGTGVVVAAVGVNVLTPFLV